MRQRMRVIAKSRYDFLNDSKEQIKGAKIQVIAEKVVEEENRTGLFSVDFGIPFEAYDDYPVVPGIYELDFEMKVGSKEVRLLGAEWVDEYDLA